MSVPGMARYRTRPSAAQPAQVQEAEMFDGACIAHQLQNSSYGRFHEYLAQCGLHQLQQDFQLPRVIVVGGRSAGKSSLLEAITKCPIFPCHQDFCTKMPIELHLKNVPSAIARQVTISYPGRERQQVQTAEDVLKEVNTIMQGVQGIDPVPIVIQICQANIPTFELVDLPGLQTYPEEQEKATTQLVSSYLDHPNTMVLCVVDATTAAFDSSVALKLVRDAGKLSNTILAMTKSDLVSTEEEYVPKIFDRILGESSDHEHLKELAGLVAVANRTAHNRLPLADADAAERDVFAKMLHKPAEAFSEAAVQRKLRDNMTVRKLIVQLDKMFHSYIVNTWKPAATKNIKGLLEQAATALSALGPLVEELDAQDVFQTILRQVDSEGLCDSIEAAFPISNYWDGQSVWFPLFEALTDPGWGTLASAKAISFVRRHALADRDAMLSSDALLRSVQQAFDAIFIADLQPKVQRFATLQSCIRDVVLPSYVAAQVADAAREMDHLYHCRLAQLHACLNKQDAQNLQQDFEAMHWAVQSCIITHVWEAIESDMPQYNPRLPEGFLLEEDHQTQCRRTALNAEMKRLRTALHQIGNIESAFTVPESPPAAVVNTAFSSADADLESTAAHVTLHRESLMATDSSISPSPGSSLGTAPSSAGSASTAHMTSSLVQADLGSDLVSPSASVESLSDLDS